MLKLGPPLSVALRSRSSQGEEDPRAASVWRNRAGALCPRGSSLGDQVGGKAAGVCEYCLGVLGHSRWRDPAETEPPRTGIPADLGDLRAESAGTKAPGSSGRGRTGTAATHILAAQAGRSLIAAAAEGRHPLPVARRGRPYAPQGSEPWATGSRGRTMKGGAPREGLALTPRSPAPPPTPGWNLGSPRDSPEPPLPPWTCPGTPALLAGSVYAANPLLEHYGEPRAQNGRNCSLSGPLRPWKKPLGGSWPWSWKMSWLPAWSPWRPKKRVQPHSTTATVGILFTASHLPHHPGRPHGPHKPGFPTHCTYVESP